MKWKRVSKTNFERPGGLVEDLGNISRDSNEQLSALELWSSRVIFIDFRSKKILNSCVKEQELGGAGQLCGASAAPGGN